MALQNIGAGNQDDAFYRYKMPKLVTKVEGRGNGIKTNLVNMVDVAKALARSPSYTTKYFGCELGAQSKFDEKTGTSIVNGAHDTAKLANLLENFIKKYVQCYGCGNPETDIVITRNHMITLKCAACGYVSDVDMRDKITSFILKNPPEVQKKGRRDGVPKLNGFRRSEKERLREGDAVDEQKKKLKRDLSKKKLKSCDEQWVKRSLRKNGVIAGDKDGVRGVGDKGCGGGGDDDDDEGIQWHTDSSMAAAKQRIKEQLSSVTSEMVMLNDFCNDEGLKKSSQKKDINAEKSPQKLHSNGDCMKISEKVKEAVHHQQECRQGNNITQMQNGNGVPKVLGEDCNDGLVDKLVKDFRNCLNMGFSTDRLAMHLHSMEGLPQRKVMEAYFLALFGGFSKGLSKEVGKRKGYLVKVIDNKASQILLLNVLESYCCTTQGIGKEIALVLKVLYDGDILEEEQILQWYDQIGGECDHKNASKVRKDALPFIQWLKEAEVEEE